MIARLARWAPAALTVAAAWFVARGIGELILAGLASSAGPDGAEGDRSPTFAAPPAVHVPTYSFTPGGTAWSHVRSETPCCRQGGRCVPPGPPADRLGHSPRRPATRSPSVAGRGVNGYVLDDRTASNLFAVPAETEAPVPPAVAAYRVGDHLDDLVVTRVAWNRVFLRRPGEAVECYLDIRHPTSAEAPTARRPAQR